MVLVSIVKSCGTSVRYRQLRLARQMRCAVFQAVLNKSRITRVVGSARDLVRGYHRYIQE